MKTSSVKEKRNLAVKSLRNSPLSTQALKRKPQLRPLQAQQMHRKWWAPCSPRQPCPPQMWRVDSSKWRPASSKLTLSKNQVCKVIWWRNKQLQCSYMANSQTSNHSRSWQRKTLHHHCLELKQCQLFKCCSRTMRAQTQALTIRSARAQFASQPTPITCRQPLTKSYIQKWWTKTCWWQEIAPSVWWPQSRQVATWQATRQARETQSMGHSR